VSNLGAKVYDQMFAAAPSNTVNDPNGPFTALYITVAGTLSFVDGLGNTVTIAGTIPIGEFPVRCQRVNTTGTSATVFGLKGVP